MPRTANKSGSNTPRTNPAVNQAQPGDPNDAILNALNADRASPDHDSAARRGAAKRQADSVERSSPEKPDRSPSTH